LNNKVQSQKVELSVPDWLEVIIRPNTAPHFKTKFRLEYRLSMDSYSEIRLPEIEDKEDDSSVVVTTLIEPYEAKS
jgi:hypothetical protein